MTCGARAGLSIARPQEFLVRGGRGSGPVWYLTLALVTPFSLDHD